MSADNYTYCPRCEEVRQNEIELKRQEVDDLYGKVSQEEYLGLVDDLNNPPPRRATLAEHYFIGVDGARFFVDYRASCDKCAFSYKYKYDTPAYKTQEEK